MTIFGKQCVFFVLENAPEILQEIYLSKEVEKSVFTRLKQLLVPIIRIDNKRAQSLAKGKNHQGIFAKIAPLKQYSTQDLLALKSLVVLCGVSDVGNIGNIVRTCYALGVDGVAVCDMSLSLSALEGIFRASSGALLKLPFCVLDSIESKDSKKENTLDFINHLRLAKFTLLGSGAIESNLKNINLDSIKSTKWALFMGKEDSGLSRKILQKMDCTLSIKMQNNFNSLNVSTACAILLDRILENRFFRK